MNIDPYILALSAITVIATIWVGFWSARKSKTASDFFVAGRSVSVGWNASAISGEYLSAASFMGVAGMVMSSGYDALWYPVCYACGYLFLLLFIAGPLRRFGAYTIPDFAEGRFDSPVFRKIAVVFVLFIGFFYTMPQMKGAGTTLAYIFQDVDLRGTFLAFMASHDTAGNALKGLPYWAGVVLVGAVITLNVALGGMKGITLVQAFQYWAKMFAISVPVFVLMSVYGHYGEHLDKNQLEPSRHLDAVKAIASPRTESPDRAAVRTADAFIRIEPERPWVTQLAAPIFTHFDGKRLVTLNHTNTPITNVLHSYAFISGKTILLAKDLGGAKVTLATNATVNTPELLALGESLLASQGITLVRRNGNLLIAAPTKDLERFRSIELSFAGSDRKPLPGKAPADSAWLNPFGPLTTKAAKAAGLSIEQQRPYSLLYTYSLIIALVCGTAGLPHILVRFYTNPDGVAAKRTTMWVMILIGIFYLFPPIFGVLGRNLLPELYSGVGAKGTDKIVLELPRILNERYGVLGSIMSGITCAGAFAAFMSTFSGLLVSMTGALAHDVYGRMLRPGSTPEQRLKAFKIAAVIVGIVAIVLGMQVEPFQINFMVGQAFAIAAASYFPLLFMSAWWSGMTMKGAASGMLGGGVLALIGISLTSFSDLKWLPLEAFWPAHPLLRILCEQPAIWTVPLAITLMVVVSKLTQTEIPADVRMKMLVLHAPEQLGLKQEYIQEHQHGH